MAPKHSLWRIERRPQPTEGHVADAVEYADGEPVRRVTLPRIDCEVLEAHAEVKKAKERAPYPQEVVQYLSATPATEVEAALRRLTLAGLITENASRQTLQ